MQNFKLVLFVIVLAIVVIGAFYVAGLLKRTNRDTAAVVQAVRALNRWETSSYSIEKIIDSGNSGNVFQQFLFGNRILLIAHGEVIGGFDLSEITAKDIQTSGTNATINLPAPQILLTTLNNAETRVYDRQKGLLVPSDNNLEADARISAEKSIRDAACTEGILNNASDNARKQLNSLLSPFGFTKITVNIPEGKC